MNKTKRIIAIMLIIYIVFNYLYSVNANEYNKRYLEALKENVDNSINNANVATDIVLQENLKGNSQQLESWIKDANTNGGTTKILESEIKIIEDNLKQAGVEIVQKDEKTNSSQGTNTQNTSQSNTNQQNNNNNNSSNQNQQTSNSNEEQSEFGETYYIPTSIKKVEGGNVYRVHASTARGAKENQVLISTMNSDNRTYYLYRSKDSKLQRTMAFVAADLSNNDNIYYIWGGKTLSQNLRQNNYAPTAVTQSCGADCSMFVAASLETAFNKANTPKGQIEFYTGDMKEKLPRYGFEIQYNGERHSIPDWGKSGKLEIGDILVVPKSESETDRGHTFIFLGPYYTTGKIAPSSAGAFGTGSGALGGYTAEGEEIDDRQNIDEKKFRFSGLPGDVTYEGEINPIRNFFKKIGDFIDYLLGLLFMIIKVIIIGFTNIIYNIFLTITSFMKK